MAKKRDEAGMQSKLMNAAIAAFCRRGLADCRMSDIADAAGAKSGNPKCRDCMAHSGYEASAVNDTFSSLGGLVRTVKATLFPS